jgi:hypothetical protein
MMRVAPRAPLALAVACLALGGCEAEKKYPHAAVHGKVTYKGKPLTFGSVAFFPTKPPEDGALMPAGGDIKPDGTYELKSRGEGGALVGEHKVVVYAVESGPAPAAAKEGDAPKADQGGMRRSILPRKYSAPDSTPLVRTVKEGDNAIDLDITD